MRQTAQRGARTGRRDWHDSRRERCAEGSTRPRRRCRRLARQGAEERRRRAAALRVRPGADAGADGAGRPRPDEGLGVRRRLGRRADAGAGRPDRPRPGQSRPRLGRVRLREGVRQADEGRQRRGDAGARQLRGRADALPRLRHRPRRGDDRGRDRRADGARRTCRTARARTRTSSASAACSRPARSTGARRSPTWSRSSSHALEPDYVVLGGGNAKLLKELPPNARLGANENAFLGGFRLWTPGCKALPAAPA